MSNLYELKIAVNVPLRLWKDIPEAELESIGDVMNDDAQIETAVETIKERLREIIPTRWQPQITSE